MAKFTETEESSMAMAALMAGLVRALEPTNPGLSERFNDQLEKTYNSARTYESEPTHLLETLKWTADFLKSPLTR